MRAETLGYPRTDKMVIAKRWSYAGHVARIWTSNQVKTLERQQTFSQTTGHPATFKPHFDDCGHKCGTEWKTVAEDPPTFDANLKEFTKIHVAQSRKIKDEDDATWIGQMRLSAPMVITKLFIVSGTNE